MTATVLFDGSVLDASITGVGRAFLDTLAAYGPRSTSRCVLLVRRELDLSLLPPLPEVEVRAVIPRGRWGRLLALRAAAREHRAALLHSAVTAMPLRVACPMVASVHDLPWRDRALLGEPGARRRRRLALALAAHSAAALVVPSRSTRDALLREHPGTTPRVHIIPHGVAPPAPDPTAVADQPPAGGPLLVIGDDRPRKNLTRVQAAHELARHRLPDLPELRHIGPPDDYVSEAEKWRLLRTARGLLHFSLLEGFGLPVLEAFAVGTPVACSDRGSLPELAGDAALVADPTDLEAMAAAIITLHGDEQRRRELRRCGLQRAAEFTTERSAEGWLQLHRSLAHV
ncbi:MAG: glycosyltransferase family 4 protein [Planctomycetes bacterium]|nr:glycosyltransferase family 4 protein [Planctomycetota bacterium]MCB9870921.1 glycosyltransferase family 4 protein [Planctomycetota bacterium]MCB9888285.1 glycosyltransferase family 4 protein [Planctomycetota bacterium]